MMQPIEHPMMRKTYIPVKALMSSWFSSVFGVLLFSHSASNENLLMQCSEHETQSFVLKNNLSNNIEA